MEGTTLGSTRLKVSRLGLGLAALGRPGYINLGHARDLGHEYQIDSMRRHCHEVLDAAWAAGVRYFDDARSYGRAEDFLASWLAKRGIQAGAVTVGSKWGYTYTADWLVEAEVHEVKEHSLAVLEQQLEQSQALLGRHLDLYQIHSATLDSGVLENAPVLQALAELKASGLAVGLTVSGPAQVETIRRALDVALDGRPLFDSVQATWNLLERSAGPALAEAHQAGLGVIIKEALANGRLTARNQSPDFESERNLLAAVAGAIRTGIDALALAAVLAQPWVDVVLSGAARVDHLESNLAALDLAWDEQIASELQSLRESSQVYWGHRAELDWN